MIDLLANLVKSITDFGLEKVFRRYYSIYRAKVTDNADPEKRGRIRVQVPALFGETDLPNFAEPRDFRFAGVNKGEFYVPDVDDWVWIEFEMGDSRFPVYSGGFYAKEEVSQTEFPHEEDIPKVRGFMNKYGHVFKFSEETDKQKVYLSTPAGNFFVLDDTKESESVFLRHKTGAQLSMDKDGSVRLVAKDGSFVNMDAVEGALTVTSKDGSTFAMKDDVTILDASGKSMVNLKDGLAQLTSSGDLVLSGGSFNLSAGSILLDANGAKLKLGANKIAIGAGVTELVDSVIQLIDALTSATVMTGTGPSSPIVPPASFQLIQLKTLLTVIKGSL